MRTSPSTNEPRAAQSGDPRPSTGPLQQAVPLSFAVCVNDEAVLAANLMTSPCLGPGAPHQVIVLRNPPNAAEALNAGRERAKHPWGRLRAPGCGPAAELGPANPRTIPAGRATIGVDRRGRGLRRRPGDRSRSSQGRPAVRRVGRVVDRDRLLLHGPDLPAPVVTLDELLLIIRRDSPLRFDADLGFHLYGADLCLRAKSADWRSWRWGPLRVGTIPGISA